MLKNKILWQILIFGGIIIILFLPGLCKLIGLKQECNKLDREIATVTMSNQALTEEKDKLANDPQYIEEVAREKMNMTGKGETVYKVIKERE